MTRTRPRVLLLVLLLALVGLLVVNGKALWLATAYERCDGAALVEELEVLMLENGAAPSKVVESESTRRVPFLAIYRKRAQWLPGPDRRVPPQVCPQCYYASRPEGLSTLLGGRAPSEPATHKRCWNTIASFVDFRGAERLDPVLTNGTLVWLGTGTGKHCTCAANHHQGAP